MNTITKGLNIEHYHSAQGISNSGLSLIKKAPKKYWQEYLSGAERKKTKALTDGDIIHTLVFEPELLTKKYTIIPDDMNINRASKEGKANHEELSKSGLPLLKSDDLKECVLIAESAKTNKAFKAFQDKSDAHIEASLFWEDDGFVLKARPDWFNDFIAIDFKTTECASPETFSKSIVTYGYHRQAAMQLDGLKAVTGRDYKYFGFLVVEKTAPYLSAFYVLDKLAIEAGRAEYLSLFETYKECMRINEWPGYTEEMQEICLPNWYKGE